MIEALPDFKLVRPETVEQALAAVQAEPRSRYLAGGTDLIVNMRRGLLDTGNLIDLGGISELQELRCDAAGLYIGAGVTLHRITEHRPIRDSYGAIAQACDVIAAPNHRTAATVGGNLCLDTRCVYYNQSHWWRKANDFCLKYKGEICHVAPQGKRCRAAFSGDLAPALMVHGAELEVAGPAGRRRIALVDFYEEDGADHLRLSPGELVVATRIPAAQTARATASTYAKVRVRGSVDFPLAGVAVAGSRNPDGSVALSIAVTGTNSRPLLIDGPAPIEPNDDAAATLAELEKQVQRQVSPQRTTTAAANYRRLAVSALARRQALSLVTALRTAST